MGWNGSVGQSIEILERKKKKNKKISLLRKIERDRAEGGPFNIVTPSHLLQKEKEKEKGTCNLNKFVPSKYYYVTIILIP